jgi:hypothetical protein
MFNHGFSLIGIIDFIRILFGRAVEKREEQNQEKQSIILNWHHEQLDLDLPPEGELQDLRMINAISID